MAVETIQDHLFEYAMHILVDMGMEAMDSDNVEEIDGVEGLPEDMKVVAVRIPNGGAVKKAIEILHSTKQAFDTVKPLDVSEIEYVRFPVFAPWDKQTHIYKIVRGSKELHLVALDCSSDKDKNYDFIFLVVTTDYDDKEKPHCLWPHVLVVKIGTGSNKTSVGISTLIPQKYIDDMEGIQQDIVTQMDVFLSFYTTLNPGATRH